MQTQFLSALQEMVSKLLFSFPVVQKERETHNSETCDYFYKSIHSGSKEYDNTVSFLPEWSQWTTWSETWEECRGENRRRTRVKCDENDDDTVVIDTNAEDCPGEL